ncbi:MAG: FtsW/RodA/SpoVE family cell cycle protein [Chloroflexota bacterium]
MSSNGNIWQRFDYPLFVVSVILVVFGVLMIRSATLDAVDPTLISRVPDQIRYALMGVVIIFALTVLDYRLLGGLHWWLYLLMVGLLALVPTFGVVGDAGARRWLNVGILIQPSEIGKIIIIITLAHHLATNYQKLGSLWALIQSLIHVMIPVLLIFIQPDLGTTIVFVVIWAVMVWGAGLRIKHIMLGIGIGIVAAPVLWTQMEPYQRSRITTFVRCSVQTCAADDDDYYNIRQAIISIGNGGVTGCA